MKKLFIIIVLIAVLCVGVYIGRRIEFRIPVSEVVNMSEYPAWYDHGMGRRLPDPNALFGRVVEMSSSFENNDTKFIAIVYEVSEDEFRSYAEECRKFGFSRITNERAKSYTMSDGLMMSNTLKLTMAGDSLFININ